MVTEKALSIAERILTNDYIDDADLTYVDIKISYYDRYSRKEEKRMKKRTAFEILFQAIREGVEK